MRPTILSIGSAISDLFIYSNQFSLQKSDQGTWLCQDYGEKIEVDKWRLISGGGGTNTAVGFARLNFAASLVSEVGRDAMADMIMSDLMAERVDMRYLIREKREETGGAVALIGPDGGRTILVHRGAAAQIDPSDLPLNWVKQADWIHISSLAGRVDTIKAIFAARNADEPNLSWTPGSAELTAIANGQILPQDINCRILVLNDTEWQEVVKQQAELLSKIPIIVVTAGREGGQVFFQGQLDHTYQIEQVEVVEETGAGDAFVVGFVAGYIKKKSLKECSEFGKLNSASVVRYIGAKQGLLTLHQLFGEDQ